MTDRELMQQALEAMGTVGANWICEASHHAKKDQHKWGEPCPLQQRWHIAYQALRERLAQPQQSHEINADTDAIGMAIHDALVCGTGVVKLWLDAGKMNFDHVSIKDFAVFGDELKWRAAHTGKEKMND